MKRSRFLFIIAVLCLVFSHPITVFASPVGIITAIEGRADITRGEDPARTAIVGDEVHIGDFLRTLSKSRLELTFIDDSVTRLAPLSRLRVTEYLFDAGERTGTIDLLRGKVQSVLVKATPDSVYEIHTPTAVAGVRGTTFFVYYRDGVTGGASREGTFYVYSKGRPDQVRIVRPGQAFLVLGIDEIPIVRPATEEELERHLDDTTIREGEDFRDEEDFLDGGDVTGDAQSGERYADAADPETELALLDPSSEPTPEQTIPTEPPLPEPIPASLPPAATGVNIFGTSTNAWGLVNISLVSSSPATMAVDGEIFDGGIIPVAEPAWIAPVSIADGTQGLVGIFAGTAGSVHSTWFGLLPGFHMTNSGVLGYTLGMLDGEGGMTPLDTYTFDGAGPADYVVLTTNLEDYDFDTPEIEAGFKGWWNLDGDTVVIPFTGAHSGTWSMVDQGSGNDWTIRTIVFDETTFSALTPMAGTSYENLYIIGLRESDDRYRAYLRGEGIAIGGDGTFEQRIAGSWIDLDDIGIPDTGVMGGALKGTFDPPGDLGTYWHAVAGGISIETDHFLAMAGTEQGRATLDQLNIPFAHVGTTFLYLFGEGDTPLDAINIWMDDVRFFAYAAGGAPLIWATGEVYGTYSGDPLWIEGGIETTGWIGDFYVTEFDGGGWNAEITGRGPVSGITGDVRIAGGAAGSYGGGSLTGTASGVVEPPP